MSILNIVSPTLKKICRETTSAAHIRKEATARAHAEACYIAIPKAQGGGGQAARHCVALSARFFLRGATSLFGVTGHGTANFRGIFNETCSAGFRTFDCWSVLRSSTSSGLKVFTSSMKLTMSVLMPFVLYEGLERGLGERLCPASMGAARVAGEHF